jgi:D-alanyl-lipoteichoic acid acyltransferase DltB (MBOAT superfamily)
MIVYLLLSAATTYIGGVFIERVFQSVDTSLISPKEQLEQQKKKNKRILTIVLLINFGILIGMKYTNFAVGNIIDILNLIGYNFKPFKLNLILPLGISFYTFQSTGYLIDVYRKKIVAEKNFFKYLLFISFFPQIIQGPISRFDQLANQLYRGHDFDYTQFKFGLQLMLWGYFKKMVIADRAGLLVDSVFNNYKEYSGLYYIFATIFYCIQIYGDFSGGIDIVRGVSQALGINLVDNFKRPYFARSVAEFWQRWHITLGTWMKDYVFYPLALSKSFGKLGRKARKKFGVFIGKQLPASIASLIVFTLVGVWHGSSWKYVAFGLYHGVFILSSTLLAPTYTKATKFLKINTQTDSWILFQISRTFFITALGRFFSRADSFKTAIRMMISSVKDWNIWILWDGSMFKLGIDLSNMILLFLSLSVLFTVSLFQERGLSIREWITKQNLTFRWAVYILGIVSVLIFGIYGTGFNNVDFIYQGF